MHLKKTLTSIAAFLLLIAFAQAADTYKIDPMHTSISFSVRHFGINNVKGNFQEFEGTLILEGEKLQAASGTIQAQSINTGVAQRDDHLRSADFFDASEYPTLSFKTKRIETDSNGQPVLIADFTMRGVTKELRLPATLSKPTLDPWGGTRVGLAAKTELNRKDYGINYHELLETGVMAVGEVVELEINAEAVKTSPETK